MAFSVASLVDLMALLFASPVMPSCLRTLQSDCLSKPLWAHRSSSSPYLRISPPAPGIFLLVCFFCLSAGIIGTLIHVFCCFFKLEVTKNKLRRVTDWPFSSAGSKFFEETACSHCGANLPDLSCLRLDLSPADWPLLDAVELMVLSEGWRRAPLVRGNKSSICCRRNVMDQTVCSFPVGVQEFRHLWNSLYSFQGRHQSSSSVSAEMSNAALNKWHHSPPLSCFKRVSLSVNWWRCMTGWKVEVFFINPSYQGWLTEFYPPLTRPFFFHSPEHWLEFKGKRLRTSQDDRNGAFWCATQADQCQRCL